MWYLDSYLSFSRPLETGQLYESRNRGSNFNGKLSQRVEEVLTTPFVPS